MIQQFQDLSTDEAAAFIEAIPLITVLIAGADGKIDDDEKEWAAKLTNIRSYSYSNSLKDFYAAVGKIYAKRVDELIDSLPEDTEKRNAAISNQLAKLNDIFPKLEIDFRKSLYDSLTSFAHHVAKASGGILRFGSVSAVEKQWISLPMITPIDDE